MNKLIPIILLLCLGAGGPAKAQTPVWSTDIAPILYNKCVSCHRTGGIAPFPLITATDAVNEQSTIEGQVQSKKMPPWPPDPYFNRLAHERLLSQKEIDKIVSWVNAGALKGDTTLAPPVPVFSNSGDLPGVADLTIKIPTFTSTANTKDVYQCFVIPSGVTVDKFINAFEAVPGNRGIVHHVLVYADTTGACAALDAAYPGPGYVNFGGVGSNSAIMLGGWVPGSPPIRLPSGFGVRLPKNADIVLQIHYPAGTSGQTDSTKVRFYFAPATRSVRIDPILNHQTNISPSPLFIPANTKKQFTEQFTSPLDASLLGLAPHMHLIGRSINCFGVTSANDTVNYIDIPDWDFHWQGFYMMRKITKISAGTTVFSNAFYDNTTGNHENPSNPPINVSEGESTTDEMMLTYFVWTTYKPGDENISIDTSTLVDLSVPNNYYRGQQLLSVYPNPASDKLLMKCYFEKQTKLDIDIIDMQGHLIKLLAKNESHAGYYVLQADIHMLPAGNYIVQVRTPEQIFREKITIAH